MNDTITIKAATGIVRELEMAAAAEGLSVEAFILSAARTRAQDLVDAKAYFVERAARGKPGAILEFLDRGGGELPRAGDEVP
jgi:uncharacterized protein (DUF1778 family)